MAACMMSERVLCKPSSNIGSAARQTLAGINGQVAMSALGSSCACPTTFTAHCPCQCIQRTHVLWQVPALTCPEWMGSDPWRGGGGGQATN